MRTFIAAAVLAIGVSAGTIAYAQIKDEPPLAAEGVRAQPLDSGPQVQPRLMTTPISEAAGEVDASDARSLASDQAVGEARRYYRNQCNQFESPGFCDCVTAGVAQALMPEEVRIAGRTIGQRINAQGDAAYASESDSTTAMSTAERIEQVEGHYADACASFRG